MSEAGREQFDAYLAELERVVRDAAPRKGGASDLSGWSIA
jgi:hypothetical protein